MEINRTTQRQAKQMNWIKQDQDSPNIFHCLNLFIQEKTDSKCFRCVSVLLMKDIFKANEKESESSYEVILTKVDISFGQLKLRQRQY